MNRSEQINELAAALAKAQAEMEAASRSGVNPQFKRPGQQEGSKYITLDDVMTVAKALAKHGIAIMQPASTNEEGTLVLVTTTLVHTSGQWVSEALRLRPVKQDPQGIGSAITYGRRYGLCSFVGIVADEDDDGNAASQRPPTKSAPSGNGNGHDAKVMEAQIEARLSADCEKGFANWAAKKEWRDLNKTAKDSLPREAQLRLSQKWVQAKPVGAVESAS